MWFKFNFLFFPNFYFYIFFHHFICLFFFLIILLCFILPFHSFAIFGKKLLLIVLYWEIYNTHNKYWVNTILKNIANPMQYPIRIARPCLKVYHHGLILHDFCIPINAHSPIIWNFSIAFQIIGDCVMRRPGVTPPKGSSLDTSRPSATRKRCFKVVDSIRIWFLVADTQLC